MRRRLIIFVLATSVIVVAIAATWSRIQFFMLTGHFVPIEEVEILQNPVAVTDWKTDGLRLADGRVVQLPGMRSLPADSAALSEATKRGVEIGADGRIRGLVKVHHWCGNDPVREHIAKVDLSEMLIFLRVGEPTGIAREPEQLSQTPGGTFTEYGWLIGEFLQFQAWQRCNPARVPPTTTAK